MSTRGMVHVVQGQSLGCGETTRPPAQSKVIAAWLLRPRGMILERSDGPPYIGLSIFLFTHRIPAGHRARKRTNNWLEGPARSIIGSAIGNTGRYGRCR